MSSRVLPLAAGKRNAWGQPTFKTAERTAANTVSPRAAVSDGEEVSQHERHNADTRAGTGPFGGS